MSDLLETPAQRWSRRLFAGVALGTVAFIVVAFRAVLLPFVLGALLAYVLHPVVEWLVRRRVRGRSAPRWVVVVAIYVVMLTGLAWGIRAAAPRLAHQIRDFARDEVPSLRRTIEQSWIPKVRAWSGRALVLFEPETPPPVEAPPADPSLRIEPVAQGGWRVVLPPDGVEVERIDDDHYRVVSAREHERDESPLRVADQLRRLGEGHVTDILRAGGGLAGRVIGGVFGFFMTLMVSAYMLVTEARIFGFARSLVPPAARPGFEVLLRRLDQGLSGVVRGQLIICMVNGVLSAIGFALAHLKYWPILALVAAVLSIIPIFGSILSSIPAVAIGLTQGWGTGLFVLAWILGIHQLEANVLNPKIMGDAARIHPVLVVFSLLAGEHFYGILGALLAVPTMSVVQSIFLHWRRHALSYTDPTESTPP